MSRTSRLHLLFVAAVAVLARAGLLAADADRASAGSDASMMANLLARPTRTPACPTRAAASMATGDVENVITPQASCSGNGSANPNAIDKYSQGYAYNDPMIKAQVTRP